MVIYKKIKDVLPNSKIIIKIYFIRIVLFLRAFRAFDVGKFYPLLKESTSQLHQDLFVLAELKYKENGFFVEFGATDGISLSNTFLLERRFNWTGILAEPAKIWEDRLRENRPDAIIDTRCVWTNSSSIFIFNETDEPELSTMDIFSNNDFHSLAREQGKKYPVHTISLNDLLEQYGAPNVVDYLSIDTEGSEFEILSALDFDKYSFSVITCEHNYSPQRENVYNLLTQKGYKRKLTSISRFDDWYVLDVLS